MGEIEPGEFIVMPNHVHGIVLINMDYNAGASGLKPRNKGKDGLISRSLGSFIRGFKTSVTIRINKIRNSPKANVWQRNYFEHIIRDENELNKAREYIFCNPKNWESDRENPQYL